MSGRASKTKLDEIAFVERTLQGCICQRCGATLESYPDLCKAALDESCPGFETVEAAKRKFHRGAGS